MKIVDECSLTIDFETGKYKDFNQFLQIKKSIDTILEKVGVNELPPDPDPYSKVGYRISYNVKLYLDLPDSKTIKSSLKLLADDFSSYYYFKYSKIEVEKSPLFLVSIESCYPKLLETDYKTENACNICGLKKIIQLNELHIDTSVMKRKNFVYEVKEGIFISGKLARELNKNSITDFELKPVIHIGDVKNKIETYQLIPTNILPPVVPCNFELEHREDYCFSCGIRGRSLFPFQYKSTEIENFKSFNYSNEYINLGNKAVKILLINSKVRQIFKSMNMKGWFPPISVVDEKTGQSC